MTSPPDVEIADLLNELFDAEELQRFLRSYYREVADCLPANLGRRPLASAAAEALARRNQIDAALFVHLHASRHRCTERIDRTAHMYDRERTAQTPSRRWTWGIAIAVGGGIATGAAVILTHVPTGPERCEEDGHCEEVPRAGEPDQGHVAPDAPASARGVLRCPAGMVLIDNIRTVGPLCLDRSEVTRSAFCSSPVGSAKLEGQGLYAAYRCEYATKEHPIAHVSKDEAVAYCGQLGRKLPERHDYVQLLYAELGGRVMASLAEAMNICGVECHKNDHLDEGSFKHADPYERSAPVGRYHHLFVSPHGLDDMFGNVREMVREGDRVFACGSGFLNSRFKELDPGRCLAADNVPLDTESRSQSLGFRCAGEPFAVVPGSSDGSPLVDNRSSADSGGRTIRKGS